MQQAAGKQQPETILLGSAALTVVPELGDALTSQGADAETIEKSLNALGLQSPVRVTVEPSEVIDSVAPAGAGFLAALETAAAPDRQPPQTAVKQLDIKVSESHVGLIIAPKPQTVPELTEPLAHYRTTVGGV